MATVISNGFIRAAFLLSFLAGCSNSDAGDPSPTRTRTPVEFSEQDKIAARALSIGNSDAMENADSPYARALLCRNGMMVLSKHFDNFAALGQQQRQAVRRADAYFDRQLQALGSSQGKSKSDIAEDLQQMNLDNSDLSLNARIALGCLRGLQD
jgi:hypothetical protein